MVKYLFHSQFFFILFIFFFYSKFFYRVIRVWDLVSQDCMFIFSSSNEILSLDFQRDTVISSCASEFQMWHAETGQEIAIPNITGWPFKYDPFLQRIVSAAHNIQIWNLNDPNSSISTRSGPECAVWSIDFDEARLVLGTHDGKIHIWDYSPLEEDISKNDNQVKDRKTLYLLGITLSLGTAIVSSMIGSKK